MSEDTKKEPDLTETPVIIEEIKKRPFSLRRVLRLVGFVLALAVLFGLTSAAVFVRAKARFENAAKPAASSEQPAAEKESGGDPASDSGYPESAGNWIDHRLYALNRGLGEINDEVSRSVVMVTGLTAKEDWFQATHKKGISASGLILRKENGTIYILTHLNILEKAEEILVTLPGGKVCRAKFTGGDPITGICIISLDEGEMDSGTWDMCRVPQYPESGSPQAGDYAIAFGSVLGYSENGEFGGVISGITSVETTDSEFTLIATDMSDSVIRNGVLADTEGRVTGWITSFFSDDRIEAVTAIPVQELMVIAEDLMEQRQSGYAGITGENVTAAVSEALEMPEGVYISEIVSGSPADRAGIMPGDVITAVDDTPVKEMRRIHRMIADADPGDSMTFDVFREGADGYVKKTFEVEIGERSEIYQ